MNYTIINELLSDDGLLVYSIFPLNLDEINKNHPLIKSIVDNKKAKKLFILDNISDGVDGVDGVFIYKKKVSGGTKKTRNYKKRARRIKNKSIKNKK